MLQGRGLVDLLAPVAHLQPPHAREELLEKGGRSYHPWASCFRAHHQDELVASSRLPAWARGRVDHP